MNKNTTKKKDFLTPQGRALVNAMKEEKELGREMFPTPFHRIYLTSVYEDMVERALERKKNREQIQNTQ